MKKVYLISIIGLLLLTGCDVKYNLNIDKELKVQEKTELTAETDQDIKKLKEFNQYIPIDYRADDFSAYQQKLKDVEYYDIEKTNETMKLNYSYNIENYNYSNLAARCYEHITISKTEDKEEKENLLLSTSKKFLCFDMYEELDEVKIVINSTYKLKETNADEVKRHTYIWNLNRTNKDNKVIYLLLDTTEQDLNFWERLKNGEYTNIFTISLLLFLIGIIIYGYLKRKSLKRDEI